MKAVVWMVFGVMLHMSSHVVLGTATIGPATGSVMEGDSYTFTCSTTQQGEYLVYFKEGTITYCQFGGMTTNEGLECGVERGEPSKYYFKIPHTYRNHSSTDWLCQAGPDQSNMAKLDVWYPPAIKSFTTNHESNKIEVNINDTVTLVCQYEGNPAADVIIKKQGRSLQTVDDDVAVRSTLTTVSCQDMATYVCQASNRFGSASSNIQLIVRCPPTQGASQGTTTTSLEGDVTLTLSVMAYPRPTFTWFGPLGNMLDANNGSLDANLNVISRITIKGVTEDDLGVYTVIVKNNLGSGNFTIALATEDPVSGGLVAGLVIGGLTILVIVAVSVVLINRKMRKEDDNDLDMDIMNSTAEDDTNGNLYAQVKKPRKESNGDSNLKEDSTNKQGLKTGVDEDGLLYVSVDVEDPPDSAVDILRTKDDDDPTQYADLAFNQPGAQDIH
ncbi:neural cell adhesion molecule 1-like [Haliotis rufescens]|uniref:neural cell adhesion molecule 1-like n=1 Tax=Haliotis rufescens TaxID=6454 RepID=UPI00201E9EA4|nr:neural cell adhesion molecule 1-like [Haliotis rufescens]